MQNGYGVLMRNFRTRLGEIDLVLQKDGLLVFCEVKTRKSGFPGGAAQAVTPQKQHKILLAAEVYLAQYQLSDPLLRFDVAEVYYSGAACTVNVIENAFCGY